MSEFLAGVAGFLLGIGGFFLYTVLLKRDARSRADSIVNEAQRDAEGKVKEAELQIRELELNQKADFEKEVAKFRDESHRTETRLQKSTADLRQQTDDLRKQEKIVETTQERLKRKLESASQRETELQQILDKQREQLHKITGLSREDASARTLETAGRRVGQGDGHADFGTRTAIG